MELSNDITVIFYMRWYANKTKGPNMSICVFWWHMQLPNIIIKDIYGNCELINRAVV